MKIRRLPVLAAAIILLTSGIYRHDRPVEKCLALANQEAFAGVGQILSIERQQWTPAGSFILIDSVTILSAAHCFVGTVKRDTVVNFQGQAIKTYIEAGRQQRNTGEFEFRVMNRQVTASRITLHPDYLKHRTCDLAIIKLNEPVRRAPAIKINQGSDELHDTVTAVGFGVSGTANEPESVALYQLKLAGNNVIDSIGGTLVKGRQSVLFADFDAPDERAGCNRTGSSVPLELEYSLGAGDSGGPLFRYEGRELSLVGIAVYAPKTVSNLVKNGYYCELNGWTRISAYSEWIKDNR